jgi:hypothetical protein
MVKTLDMARKLVGDELSAKLKPIMRVDEEGELIGMWRDDTGLENLWYGLGKCL